MWVTQTQHPQSVVAAAFTLKEVGDLSDVLTTDKGFAIFKLTDNQAENGASIRFATFTSPRFLSMAPHCDVSTKTPCPVEPERSGFSGQVRGD